MFWSGVAIGITQIIIAQVVRPTLRDHPAGSSALCVAVVGAAKQGTVVSRIVATTIRLLVATIAASVLCVYHSLEQLRKQLLL